MNSLRIATWNLDNAPQTSARATACRAKIVEIQAHVWVLTETRQGFSPGDNFHLIAQSKQACDLATDWRWTSIWVQEPLAGKNIETSDPERTACARLEIPGGYTLKVYGTVLPWLGSTWKKIRNEGGQAFAAALAVQKADWSMLREAASDALLCVAGDFNQDLLESGHYYGSKITRKMLREALDQAKLECLTGGKTDPVARLNPGKANIDHICLGGSVPLVSKPVKVVAWSPEHQGIKVSDHFAVSVEIN